MKLQIIQLEPYDDVVSIRDRLSFVSTERVLLVWPRRGEILKRKLDLLLIQREAARQGARLALITGDPAVLDHAAELNISTFESIKASQRGKWKRPRSKVFVDRTDRPEDAPDAYELRELTSRLRPVSLERAQLQRSIRRAAAVALGIFLLIVIVLFVPSAQVTIPPAQAQINTTVKLIADPSLAQVNVESGHIPATILKTDVTTQATIPSTGSSNVPNTLASGTVIFTNNTDKPVFIPSGTEVSTFGFQPPHFHTTADPTLDGGSGKTVSVTVEAAQDTAAAAGDTRADPCKQRPR